MTRMRPTFSFLTLSLLAASFAATAQELPRILQDGQATPYLPDFSYAGYEFGLASLPAPRGKIIDVSDHGAVADDALDDSKAVLAALEAAHAVRGPVRLRFPAGRFILSEVLPISRSDIAIEGAGQGDGGTELYFPRPLRMIDKSDRLAVLRGYLVDNDKRQLEPRANIDEPFSEYSWSGGFLWIKAPGIDAGEEYGAASERIEGAAVATGVRGETTVVLSQPTGLEVGDVVSIRWASTRGRDSGLLTELFGDHAHEAGSRMWENPERAIVVQTTRIEAIDGTKVRIADPLLHAIGEAVPAEIEPWRGLTEVGIRDLAIVFPEGQDFGHHLEQGWNGIYMTDVFNGWIHSVRVSNADSGVLTYNSGNLTIRDVRTEGVRKAHYSVHIGSVHNALVSGLQVHNPVRHALSVNTRATRSVFQRATVWQDPVIDQHAGANHQNLFDDITFHVQARRANGKAVYPLWDGSGASYWQPGHGRFNTHWNLRVIVDSGAAPDEPVLLQGLEEGPEARLVGISGNRRFEVDYRPAPYTEMLNEAVHAAPSLYDWQLARRRR